MEEGFVLLFVDNSVVRVFWSCGGRDVMAGIVNAEVMKALFFHLRNFPYYHRDFPVTGGR